MKKLMLFLLLTVQTQAFALSGKASTSNNNLLQKASLSLLQSTQDVRLLSERHLDRVVEVKPELPQLSCADVKDTLSQFSARRAALKNDFENASSKYDSQFVKSFNVKLKSLDYLTERSLNKCADPEVGWLLDLLRNELMSTGFLIQTYQSSQSI